MGKKGKTPEPVRIRGIDYPSHEAAAKALGVAPCTVSSALARGRADFIGLGRSRKHRRNEAYSRQATSRPLAIGAMTWPSRAACARTLGVPRSVLKRHVVAGNTEWLMARAMAAKAREEGHKARRPRTHDAETVDAIRNSVKSAWESKRGEA